MISLNVLGQPHYQLRIHNITRAELEAGRRDHVAMLSSYDDSKKIITMKHLYNECYKFNRRCLFPCVVPIEFALTYMIQSGIMKFIIIMHHTTNYNNLTSSYAI